MRPIKLRKELCITALPPQILRGVQFSKAEAKSIFACAYVCARAKLLRSVFSTLKVYFSNSKESFPQKILKNTKAS